MKNHRTTSAAALAITLACASHALAATATFNASADTLMANGSLTNNNFSTSVANEIAANGSPYTTSRTLTEFNVSPLAGAYTTVDAITLNLTTSYVIRGPGNTNATETLQVYQAVSNWIDSQTTWTNRQTATPWTTAGGDFNPAVFGTLNWSAVPTSVGAVDASEVHLTVNILPGAANAAARKSLIDSWTSGANNGLLIHNNNESATTHILGLRSSENSVAADRPTLTVQYNQPVTAQKELWLKADNLALSNGAAVSTWSDSSGHSRDAFQSNAGSKPTFQTNVINGKSVVHFTGTATTGQYLTDSLNTTLNQQYTIFAVARITGNAAAGHVDPSGPVGATDYIYDSADPTNRVALGVNSTGANDSDIFTYAGGATVEDAAFTRSQWQNFHIYEGLYNGASSSLFIDGTNSGTGALGANALQTLTIGAQVNHLYFLNGDIAELIVYSGALTDDQRNAIGYSLGQYYSLTTTYTAPEPTTLALLTLATPLLLKRRKTS